MEGYLTLLSGSYPRARFEPVAGTFQQERVNRAEERCARMCLCGKGWGEDIKGSGGNGV